MWERRDREVSSYPNEVLCIRTHEMTGDLWHFFGRWFSSEGIIEMGEITEQAALREVRGETRIALSECSRAQREPVLLRDLALPVSVFVGFTDPSAQVILNDEHSAFAWLNTAEAAPHLPLSTQRVALRTICEHCMAQQLEETLRVF
jgi:dATP pyrophosphohydrolase